MQILKIYCNYGCLSAEKRNVYTYGAPGTTATCWDEMEVEVPEGWELYENRIGKTMVISPWGEGYEINEVLQGNEKPCFYALDHGGKGHRYFLKEMEE